MVFRGHGAVEKRRYPGGRAKIISYLGSVTVGGGGGGAFEVLPKERALLIGLNLHTDFSSSHRVIKSIRPVFLTRAGGMPGSGKALSPDDKVVVAGRSVDQYRITTLELGGAS